MHVLISRSLETKQAHLAVCQKTPNVSPTSHLPTPGSLTLVANLYRTPQQTSSPCSPLTIRSGEEERSFPSVVSSHVSQEADTRLPVSTTPCPQLSGARSRKGTLMLPATWFKSSQKQFLPSPLHFPYLGCAADFPVGYSLSSPSYPLLCLSPQRPGTGTEEAQWLPEGDPSPED